MSDAFDIAKKNLNIIKVEMRNFSAEIKDGVEPAQINRVLNTDALEDYSGVAKVRTYHLEDDGGDREWFHYHFHYAVGIRLVINRDDDKEVSTEPILTITAKFNAIYFSRVELGEDAVTAFAEQNVGYHIWPYWREFVSSTCARLSIKNIPVEFYFVHNSVQNTNSASEK